MLRVAACFQFWNLDKETREKQEREKKTPDEAQSMKVKLDRYCYIDPVVCKNSIIVNTFPSTNHQHIQFILGRLVYLHDGATATKLIITLLFWRRLGKVRRRRRSRL